MRFDSTQLKELEMIPILIGKLTKAINDYLKFDIKLSFLIKQIDRIVHIKLLEKEFKDFQHDFSLKWFKPDLSLWNDSEFSIDSDGIIAQILVKSNHKIILGSIEKK